MLIKKNVYFELTFFIWCTGSEIREDESKADLDIKIDVWREF